MVIKPQLFVYLRLVLTILTKYQPLGEDLPQVCQVGQVGQVH